MTTDGRKYHHKTTPENITEESGIQLPEEQVHQASLKEAQRTRDKGVAWATSTSTPTTTTPTPTPLGWCRRDVLLADALQLLWQCQAIASNITKKSHRKAEGVARRTVVHTIAHMEGHPSITTASSVGKWCKSSRWRM